ncbi:DoxX family membrane protein [Streptomyces sp. NPDC000594]|uniref:DoxX family membrane protein n=1 Tax=Streptomyces sp. NPDC000594 TaxID=3154261 RepID=UPI00332F30FA
MSVDTRTPRPGFDDQPALSMVKVDCDPAQVIVNHASFRVRLAQSPRPARAFADTLRVPAVAGAGARRRAPVVWTGRTEPGDAGATGLLQAVRNSTATTAERGGGYDAGATQVIPRIDLGPGARPYGDPADTGTAPVPKLPAGPLLPPMRQAVGAYDAYPPDGRGPYGGSGRYDEYPDGPGDTAGTDRDRRAGADSVRHAYYPGRRMNLGVVLLPLRVFLGLISVYAGMGKLCDPVYFDGGERGSMVKWLNSLNPWALAEPLRDFALSHPVGAGLTVAFLQVVVGVLTVLGLWQRVAAGVGVLLSAALILTVSWRTVPVYDAPDFIYLAAWSPLIIAGAPVYSIDGRLAGEAWRTLGPRAELWELRRRVLRRGAVVATVVVGLTLLIGSMLGGAVRSTDMVTVPRPDQDPSNHLPGSPLPKDRPSGERSSAGPEGREPGSPRPAASSTGTPAAEPPVEPAAGTGAGAGAGVAPETAAGRPSESQGVREAPPSAVREQVPPPSGSGSGSGSTGTSSGSSSPEGTDAPGSSSGGDSAPARVIGGLLG